MNKFINRLCMVTGLLYACFSVKAQSYSFTQATTSYADLSGATVIPFGDFDPQSDLYWVNDLIGETFYFYGRPYKFDTSAKYLFIQSNGDLRIDNDSTLAIIDGAFTYLDSINAQSSVSYKIVGASGSKILKVQWKNMKVRVGQAGNYLNMQIWVYQQNGVVEIHYGPRSASNASGFNVNTGPQVGMFLSGFAFTQCLEKLWVNGSPTSPLLDSNANYVFKAMSGIPSAGTLYRFTPRFLTGIKEPEEKLQFRCYPNPVNDMVYFNKSDDYFITDIAGKKLIDAKGVVSIDITNLPMGIYFICNTTGGRVKIVKQ